MSCLDVLRQQKVSGMNSFLLEQAEHTNTSTWVPRVSVMIEPHSTFGETAIHIIATTDHMSQFAPEKWITRDHRAEQETHPSLIREDTIHSQLFHRCSDGLARADRLTHHRAPHVAPSSVRGV